MTAGAAFQAAPANHPIRQGMEFTRYAEERGFDAVWQAESRLVREATVPMAAFATAGAVPRLGYASAAGVFFGVAIMGLTILQIVAVRHLRNRGRTDAA